MPHPHAPLYYIFLFDKLAHPPPKEVIDSIRKRLEEQAVQDDETKAIEMSDEV